MIIVNTNIGNFKSIQNMLSRIGIKSIITDSYADIMRADKLILPGVGSFDRGMEALAKNKIIDAIRYKVLEEKTKILGICLGMQMFAKKSDEGNAEGLALIDGVVKKFNFDGLNHQKKIPHMGWNYVIPKDNVDIFQNFEVIPRFYFTHSYFFECQNLNNVIASTPYGIEFCSAIQKDNIYGVQFHPEKSHRFGMQLLKNFVKC